MQNKNDDCQESNLLKISCGLPGEWYVAHTRARNEKILAKEFTRMEIFYYLPLTLHETRSPVTRRISRSMLPVFPGYLFFKGTEEQRYRALTTNRVANVLNVPDQDQLIAELKQIYLLLANTCNIHVTKKLQIGEWGRIITGPLRDLEGVVTRHLGRWRLNINVTILGQSVNVEVNSSNVKQIDPPDYALQATR